MIKLLFVELDDTLFQSHNKCTPSTDSTPMAYLQDGSAISYANVKQLSMLKFWQQNYMMIPVTARNFDAFSRVAIQLSHGAVINYGGTVLLNDGSIDDYWRQKSEGHAQQSQPILRDLVECLTEFSASVPTAELSVRIISDDGIDFYSLLKSKTGNLTQVSAAAEMICGLIKNEGLESYQVHHNGNNLAIMPPWLNKRNAVRYLLEQWQQKGDIVTLGMGDSIIDLGFMSECDYLVVPNYSQIVNQRMQA